MAMYNFKKIQPVPSGKDFIDIILSKTQRKTPTVVHKGYAIGRIRSFYMRKVKYTQENFSEKLTQILDDFPKLNDVHPFYSALMNVLYDKDHYKLALGQLNMARHLIENVGKDYLRLLKFADSLYRCKTLKRAALGRMCTIMKRHHNSLGYLEQVRQHLARLPSIDPNTRTLIICGYPNVGKSSFMNKVTRAEVDVQPYAFTTKSLFVGHMDYKYVRWQVIDTPGILDRPLPEMNTTEMQSVTALAHIRAAVMFFIDISEQCGWSIQAQVNLFNNVKPLFANKPLTVVLSKIDLVRPEALSEEQKTLLQSVLTEGVEMMAISSMSEEGVMDARNNSCDRLLASRVEPKMASKKVESIMNRLVVATPQLRDDIARPANIPDSVKEKRAAAAAGITPMEGTKRLMKDIERDAGGAGQFSFDLREHHVLRNEDWKFDVMPEIMDGHNIADFIDPDIEEMLNNLDREEEERERQAELEGVNEEEDEDPDLEHERKMAIAAIRRKKAQILAESKANKATNSKGLPRTKKPRVTAGEMRERMGEVGIDASAAAAEASRARGRSVERSRIRQRSASRGDAGSDGEENAMDVDSGDRPSKIPRTASKSRARSHSRESTRDLGFANDKAKEVARARMKKAQQQFIQAGRAGESDRHVHTKLPKHLFSGNRSNGKTDRR